MKIFLTGGTGLVGKSVIEELLKKGYEVRVLVRKGSEKKIPDKLRKKCKLVEGDVLDRETVRRGSEGTDAIINLVGIIREYPKKGITYERLHVEATFNCVLAAQENNTKRFLQMSSMKTSDDSVSDYHKTKFQGEELVKSSGIDYTIFQPSMIFGPGDVSINMFRDSIKKYPVSPILGPAKIQPVHVDDVAKAVVMSLENKKVINKTLELGGPKTYTLKQMADLIAKSMRKKILKPIAPYFIMRIITYFFQGFSWYPITNNMLVMLQEDNVVQKENFDKILKIKLKSLESYLKEINNS